MILFYIPQKKTALLNSASDIIRHFRTLKWVALVSLRTTSSHVRHVAIIESDSQKFRKNPSTVSKIEEFSNKILHALLFSPTCVPDVRSISTILSAVYMLNNNSVRPVKLRCPWYLLILIDTQAWEAPFRRFVLLEVAQVSVNLWEDKGSIVRKANFSSTHRLYRGRTAAIDSCKHWPQSATEPAIHVQTSVKLYLTRWFLKVYWFPFSTSMLSFKENLSSLFPWDLPVVKISPGWVTGPEQCKLSGRIATFSLWTGMFRDGISSIPGETVIPLWLGRHFLVYENRVYHEKVRMTIG